MLHLAAGIRMQHTSLGGTTNGERGTRSKLLFPDILGARICGCYAGGRGFESRVGA
jgi:hypothetical protein